VITIYVTSFYNWAHNLKTGRPIGHECYIIPPAALQAEIAGDYDAASRIISEGKGPIVKGRKLRDEVNHK
jgi:hypothetical protein